MDAYKVLHDYCKSIVENTMDNRKKHATELTTRLSEIFCKEKYQKSFIADINTLITIQVDELDDDIVS